MKRELCVIGLLSGLWITAIYAEPYNTPNPNVDPNKRGSALDLYYKLYRQSEQVQRQIEKDNQAAIEAQKKIIDRHHKIQRIGPDPKPEDDQTLSYPVETNPLKSPYKQQDAEKRLPSEHSATDEATSDKDPNNALDGPSDEPVENLDKRPSQPNSAIVMPENRDNVRPNALMKPEEQQKFLEDKNQPLKNDQERGANPKTEHNDPLKTPEY